MDGCPSRKDIAQFEGIAIMSNTISNVRSVNSFIFYNYFSFSSGSEKLYSHKVKI